MSKFILKLAILVAGIYLLMQIPFFAKYAQMLKADIMEKVHNVTTEVDRVQGKITGIEQEAIEAKNKANAVANELSKTADSVKDALNSVDKAAEEIKGALGGKGETVTEGAPTAPTPTPTPAPAPETTTAPTTPPSN